MQTSKFNMYKTKIFGSLVLTAMARAMLKNVCRMVLP